MIRDGRVRPEREGGGNSKAPPGDGGFVSLLTIKGDDGQ